MTRSESAPDPTPHTPQRHLWLKARWILLDLAIVCAAYALVFAVVALVTSLDVPLSLSVVGLCALGLVSASYLSGVYQRLWRHTSGHGITVLLQSVGLATLILVPGIYFWLRQPRFVPMILLGNALAFSGFVAARYRSRLLSGALWRWRAIAFQEFPRQRTRVLIVGAGEAGQEVALRLIHRFSKTPYTVAGFIDDDPGKQGMFVEGRRVLGTRHEIGSLVEALHIDLIVVAIHNIAGPDIRDILTRCEQTDALIKVVPDLEALVNARHAVGLLRDVQAEDLIGRTTVTHFKAVDLAPVREKVILVTGAAGSIGAELSRQMLNYQPTQVVLLDNNESGLHDLATELQTRAPEIALTTVLADITQPDLLRAVYENHRPQIVFHAAAYKHVPMLEAYPGEGLRINLHGTRQVATLAQEFAVERFVLISTDKAVQPSSVMGATKRACELLLAALSQQPGNRTRFASVRFGNVLGSRGSVVPTFNRQIERGGPVTVTHAEMTRYFMSIPEAVNLIIHAACLTQGNDIYVLSMGEVVRIVDLAERMIRLRGLRPHTDIEIQYTGIRPGEKLHEQLFYSAEAPHPTLHPNILQVDNRRERFDGARYLQRVEQMASKRGSLPEQIVADLYQLIEIPERAGESPKVAAAMRATGGQG